MSDVRLITRNLGQHLIEQINAATSICILTSFVMKSGVRVLNDALKAAAERGADIKICTGDYLCITQPDALDLLLTIDPRIEIRIWQSKGVSFHPKAYLFQNGESDSLFVGSSNLSKSALNHGVEWSLSVTDEKEVYADGLYQFLKLFYDEQTLPLNKETAKIYREQYEMYNKDNGIFVQKMTESEEIDLMIGGGTEEVHPTEIIYDPVSPYGDIQPRFAQQEALEELNKTLSEEYSKALVVMATGLGKTYLAGFFALQFKRILFIGHLEEILYQAKKSFQVIMPDKNYSIYNGRFKESQGDVVFASIYTLSMKRHLEVFSRDDFDLIIIDEFHHAAADSYQNVLKYCQPKFLLGMTATPDRNDNKDVYGICDGNVAYKVDFLEAINREWLAPFQYFGIYDDTDYSQISWLGNRYDEQELLSIQLQDSMAEKIFNAWFEKKQTRTIGFCSSIKQADFLSRYFNSKGVSTVSLHSQQRNVVRQEAIGKLSKGELDVIFTVNLFNEGVDIPAVDTLLFVRPTESLTVFTQQIGRGLRLYETKDHCVIIDLIGNYRNADLKISLFDTGAPTGKAKVQPVLPNLCELHLETKVINLLNEMKRKKQPRKEKLEADYFSLKQELGRRPSYLELHLKGKSPSPHYKQEFSSYYGFLEYAGELTNDESDVYFGYQDWFVEVEKIDMTKSYKMIVLLAMLEKGPEEWYQPITSTEVAPFFHGYLTEKEYRKQIDFSDETSKKLWEYNEKKIASLIERMPMTKWSGSSKGLVSFENSTLALKFKVEPEDREILYNITKDICLYRLHFHFERKSKMN